MTRDDLRRASEDFRLVSVRREDWFRVAKVLGYDVRLRHVGPLWIDLILSSAELSAIACAFIPFSLPKQE